MELQAGKPLIMIVDDETEILKVLAKILEDDYELITAGNGKEALEKMTPKVSVILADQRMPEMTGSELMRIIKQRFPNTVRILMTGYTDMNALVDSVNEGEIFRYINKPWEVKMLLETLQLGVEKNQQNIMYEKLLEHNKLLLERNQQVADRLNQTIQELNKVGEELRSLKESKKS